MSKQQRRAQAPKPYTGRRSSEHVQAVQGRRASNAAGFHKQADRNSRRTDWTDPRNW